ncbi:response regulator [Methanospirillum sp.]|uniref:response regulator n=1 Tax=Methanospirillum sp. TaxID=45200 RepID=UPI0035A04E05
MAVIRILLVDDQAELLDITRIFLEKGGDILVDTSTSAISALQMLKEQKYDAIVSDYEMPQMDGIEFLKTIKRKGLEKPFIIFTGKSREEVVIDALNSGADFYLQKGSKPKVQYAELRNMIHQAVMRKRVEEALIQSETNYKTLVESTHDSIYMVDRRGKYLFMNSHHKTRLGIDNKDFKNYYYEDLHSEEETNNFLKLIKEVIKESKPLHNEYYKGNRWFVRTISPVRNKILDLTIAATVISTEVTRTKILEERINTLEERYKTILEAMQDSVYVVDPQCRYKFVNSHHQKRLGISGDYIGKRYGDYHDDSSTERFSSYVQKVVETKKPVCEQYNNDSRKIIRTYSPVIDQKLQTVKEIVIISIESQDKIKNSQ